MGIRQLARHHVFSALKALDASSGSFEAVRRARHNLLVLTATAIAGIVLASAVGVVAVTWTFRALQSATEAAVAVRLHARIDFVHDAIREDIVQVNQGSADARDELVRHLHELEASLQGLQQRELPSAIASGLREQASQLRGFGSRARRLAEQGIVSAEDLRLLTQEWREHEALLEESTGRLLQVIAGAEASGRRAYHSGLALLAASLLAILAGVLLAARRISQAVLATNLQLAAATSAARQAEKSRGEFLAAMSHEIRTPMTGVLGMVDLLAAEDLGARQRQYVESLRASGQHLLTIINDILDFTRIESGRLELEEVDFCLPEMLERLRSLVNPLAVDHGIALDLHIAPETPAVLRGDPTRIQQVLLNLVSNGLKFTSRGAVSVHARLLREEEGVLHYRFEVRDTGIGIPPERLPDLFSAFRQADESIARRYGGSGLGLAICKRLVEAMGGSIGVHSTPGLGSLFFFELPLAPGDPARLAVQNGEAAASAAPRRILVAEDVEINREILRTALEKAGHSVVFAPDGAQAVQLVQQRDFDLVLMDVQMPVMDGIEATRRIRKLPPPRGELPILALTANVMAQERDRYLAAGMDECLTKPIDWKQLFAAIARHTPGGNQPVPPEEGDDGDAPGVLLVDTATLDRLAAMAGGDTVREWVATALASYEKGCSAIAAPGATAEGVAAEAHKIKGSGTTLGMPRIGELAAQIEEAAAAGSVPDQHVAQLQEAVAATRARLAQLELI